MDREKIMQEMIENIRKTQGAEHLTEVAMPGVYSPVNKDNMRPQDINH